MLFSNLSMFSSNGSGGSIIDYWSYSSKSNYYSGTTGISDSFKINSSVLYYSSVNSKSNYYSVLNFVP